MMRIRYGAIPLAVVLLGLSVAAGAQTAPAPSTQAVPASAASIPGPGQHVPALPPLPPVDTTAFKNIQDRMMPLTPDEIRQLHRKIDAADRAAAAPPRFVPLPVSSSMVAVLSPGATPPVVRLFPNYVTNILFIDEAGHPLDIKKVDIPNKSAFTVTFGDGKNQPSNDITVSPRRMYATGNIAVHLVGVQVPVAVMLVSGQREVDTRAGIRVAGIGVQPSDQLPAQADARLQAFLDGVPPKDAKALTSSTPSVQVWTYDGDFVVRMGASQILMSPAYLQRKSSPDGTTVYVIPPVSPFMTLSDGGQPLNVTVSGY